MARARRAPFNRQSLEFKTAPLHRLTTGSALPKFPQSVPPGLRISWLHWFASATACQVARPPIRIRLDRSAFGTFTSRLSTDQSPSPLLQQWLDLLLLPGLAPAGMAASFAARSKGEILAASECRPLLPPITDIQRPLRQSVRCRFCCKSRLLAMAVGHFVRSGRL